MRTSIILKITPYLILLNCLWMFVHSFFKFTRIPQIYGYSISLTIAFCCLNYYFKKRHIIAQQNRFVCVFYNILIFYTVIVHNLPCFLLIMYRNSAHRFLFDCDDPFVHITFNPPCSCCFFHSATDCRLALFLCCHLMKPFRIAFFRNCRNFRITAFPVLCLWKYSCSAWTNMQFLIFLNRDIICYCFRFSRGAFLFRVLFTFRFHCDN